MTSRSDSYNRRFLSTPSVRRATCHVYAVLCGDRKFLSTPSVRRATKLWKEMYKDLKISIHALREEGDEKEHGVTPEQCNFYPRPP